jgi:hypothetical protein
MCSVYDVRVSPNVFEEKVVGIVDLETSIFILAAWLTCSYLNYFTLLLESKVLDKNLDKDAIKSVLVLGPLLLPFAFILFFHFLGVLKCQKR